MGLSGFRGKVYFINNSCPTVDCTQFTRPGGDAICWEDEVTKFTIVDSVNKKEYGHDKSQGWQDVSAGIRKATITLDAKIVKQGGAGGASILSAGRVLYLGLYPFGKKGRTPAEGYAMVDQVSYTYDQETGDPMSYTATLSSKGPWKGLGGTKWGGFECLNEAGSTGSTAGSDGSVGAGAFSSDGGGSSMG